MNANQDRFAGLAFPVVKVRYAGPTDSKGSRWIASMERSREQRYRATVPYDSSLPSGATQAVLAARKCFAKHLASYDSGQTVDDYQAVPGSLDSDTYVFLFVDNAIMERQS